MSSLLSERMCRVLRITIDLVLSKTHSLITSLLRSARIAGSDTRMPREDPLLEAVRGLMQNINRMEKKLDHIHSDVVNLKEMMKMADVKLDDLIADEAADEALLGKVIAILSDIAQKLNAAGQDSAKLNALHNSLAGMAKTMQDAIDSQTPAPAPAPAPDPVPVPPDTTS